MGGNFVEKDLFLAVSTDDEGDLLQVQHSKWTLSEKTPDQKQETLAQQARVRPQIVRILRLIR